MPDAPKHLAIILIATAIALGLAWLADDGSRTLAGLPLLPALALLALGVQWAVFVPSYLSQSEHYFDLTGSLTYLTVIWIAAGTRLAEGMDTRTLLLAVLVSAWAGRLGLFLFRRIRASGKDGRFDEIKTKPLRFAMTWTLQGLWVVLTLYAALIAISQAGSKPFGALAALGLAVWIAGFVIEAVADGQKSAFNATPENKNRFVDVGLWRWSRHPNYFGEITLWTGIALIATPTFAGWQWLGWLSPLFVAFLLIRVSGIPMLEERADEKWGGQEDYEAYKARTPVLIPRPPKD